MSAIVEAPVAAPAGTRAAPVPGARPRAERLVFLDAVRGFALIFMVLNHTGRWWQDRSMGWPWYYTIYVTMAVAAPTFIFLVGFCLPLSLSRVGGRVADQVLPTLWKYAKRGGRIVLAGLLLNVLVFPEDPIWNNGVLQTIGFSIIVAAPVGLVLRSRMARLLVVAAAVLVYLSFDWCYPLLTRWVAAYPTSSRVLFFEFPPWPWVGLVLFGLVLGQAWVEQTDARARARYMTAMAISGLLCIAWLFAYDAWAHTEYRFMFKRDFILNDHWTPRGATVVWVIGMTFVLLAVFYYLGQVRRWRLTWLVTLGQTALFLYFIHQLIVLTLVNQTLHRRFNNWWLYGVAIALLMAALLGIGRAWIEIKRVTRAFQALAPLPRLLFSFDGRLPRSGFWLAQIYLSMVAYSVVGFAGEVDKLAGPGRWPLLALLVAAECTAIWINLGVLARRWHDRGKSGWMSLILLIPIVGVVWLYVELGGQRGTVGPNRYGADPLDSLGRLQPAAP
jgi:uncharacterized membrane protein YhaH (DUF805 family)/uncharacterized membrane protein